MGKQVKKQTLSQGKTVTLTFGECAENHEGMQKLGDIAEEGFTCAELIEIKRELEKNFNAKCQLIDLFEALPSSYHAQQGSRKASILVVRGGVDLILDTCSKNSADLMKE
jgi:hypothetical protein